MDEVISLSSFYSNIGCRFRPRLGLLSTAVVYGGAVVLLFCAVLLLASTAASVSSTTAHASAANCRSTVTCWASTSISYISYGLISPMTICLIASQGGSSLPTT